MASRVIKAGEDMGLGRQPQRVSVPPPQDADAMVQDAQAEVAGRLARAEEEAAAQMEAARQQGVEEGRQSAAEFTELSSRLAEQLGVGLEKEALQAAVEATRELIALELKQRPRAIVDVVKRALGSAKHQKEIFVRAHPKDAAVLRENKRELLDSLSRARDIDIRDDAAVVQGGCVVETEIGMVDAEIGSQLERLGRLLVGRN
jgi:type III secretion protein L